MGKYDLNVTFDQKGLYTTGDIITGLVDLQIKKAVDIKEIYLEFIGRSKTTFTHYKNTVKKDIYERVRGSNETRVYREDHDFLKMTHPFFPSPDLEQGSGHTFVENSRHMYTFRIEIPKYCSNEMFEGILPPSMEMVSDSNVSAEITYLLQVSLKTSSMFNMNKTVTIPILYKPANDEDLTCYDVQRLARKTMVVEHKIKKLLESNEDQRRIISNPIESGHKKTRFIRSIFNDTYKSDKYFKLVHDVPLEIGFVTEKNVLEPGAKLDSFKLRIYSPVKTLAPDFVLESGESSKLGEFQISKIKFTLIEETYVRAIRFAKTLKRAVLLADLDYDDLAFDIADFEEEVGSGYVKSFDSSEILKKQKEIKIPLTVWPDFMCCNKQIEKTFSLGVELHLLSDGKIVKFIFQKDLRIVDLRVNTMAYHMLTNSMRKLSVNEPVPAYDGPSDFSKDEKIPYEALSSGAVAEMPDLTELPDYREKQ